MNPKYHTVVGLYFWFILMVIGNAFFPGPRLIAFPLTFGGITLLAIGIWINVLSGKTLRDRETTSSYATKPSQLVTTGPFRISRNPMYIGTIIVLSGAAVLFGTLTPFICVAGWWFTLNFLFIPVEESLMEQAFGNEYLDYRSKVRRWF